MATLFSYQSGAIDGGIDSNHQGTWVSFLAGITYTTFNSSAPTVTLTLDRPASGLGLQVGDWVRYSVHPFSSDPSTYPSVVSNIQPTAFQVAAVGSGSPGNTLVLSCPGSTFLTQAQTWSLFQTVAAPANGDTCIILGWCQVTQTATMATAPAQVIISGVLNDDGTGNPLAVSGGVTLGSSSTLDGVTILGPVADDATASGGPVSLAPLHSIRVLGDLSITNAGVLTVGNDTLTNEVTFPDAGSGNLGWIATLANDANGDNSYFSYNSNYYFMGFMFPVAIFNVNNTAGWAVGQYVIFGDNAQASDLAGGHFSIGQVVVVQGQTVGFTIVASNNDSYGNLPNSYTLNGWFQLLHVLPVLATAYDGAGNVTVQVTSIAGLTAGTTVVLAGPTSASSFYNDCNNVTAPPVSATVGAVRGPSYSPTGAGLDVYGACTLSPQQPILQCGPIRSYAPLLPAADLVAAGHGYGYLATPLAQSGVLDLPPAADVKRGVSYGGGTFTGTLASGGRTSILI